MAALRWGLIFGAGIAAANLVLQFVVTPFAPWQLVGALSVGVWLVGITAAGLFAGSRSPRIGRSCAAAAAIAAAVDLVRNATVLIAVGVPAGPSSVLRGSPTPGMIIAGTIAEFLLLLGPVAVGIGLAVARLSRRSPAPQAVIGD